MKAPLTKSFAPVINIGIFCIALVISCILMNRAFIIGSLSGIVFLLFSYRKIKARRNIFLACGGLVLVSTFFSYFFKTDSSLGRLFIYKVSWRMFLEKPMSGIGWGSFAREYGLHQANYFQSANFTQREFLLADNVYFAFNDYWQVVIETGLVGGVCLLVVLVAIVVRIHHRLTVNSNDHQLKFVVGALLVLGMAAVFTHVFYHKPYAITAISFLTYAMLPIQTRYNTFWLAPLMLMLLVLPTVGLAYSRELRHYKHYKMLAKAKALAEIGYLREARSLYSSLYPTLRGDAYFLRKYSEAMNGDEMAQKRLLLLKAIAKSSTDNILYLNIGHSYEALGMRKDAEGAYLKSVNIVPNRFVPREALFNFYLKNNDFRQARLLRETILSMPVKVPSETIEKIILRVKQTPL